MGQHFTSIVNSESSEDAEYSPSHSGGFHKMVSPRGLELLTCGLGNHMPERVSNCDEMVYDDELRLHVGQHVGTTDPDLARVVAVWQRLAQPIKKAIKALVESAEE